MSYCSDVRINTNVMGHSRLIDLVGDELTILSPTIDVDGDSVILGWDGTDWRDSKCFSVEMALRTLDMEGYPYEFIRLGESDGDEEFMNSNEELLDRHNGLELTVPRTINNAKSAGADGLADEISIGKDRSG